MPQKLRIFSSALLALAAALGGCSSAPQAPSQAMTQAPAQALPQAPGQPAQEVRTPLPPATIQRDSSAAAAAPAPYVALQLGYSKGRGANFKEDNQASPDCFMSLPTTGCAGSLNHLGSSPTFGIAVGYRFSPTLRADVGYQRRHGFNLSGADAAGTYFDPKVASDALMVSGFYDIPYRFSGQVQPYVGLAVGRSRNKMDALRWSDPGCCSGMLNDGATHNSTAWQLTLGGTIPVVRGWVLDAAYRYSDLGDFKKPAGADLSGNFTGSGMTTSATGKLRSNELMLNLRFSFP